MDEYFPLGQDEAVTDEDEFDDTDEDEEDDEDDYAVESVRRAYFGGRTVDFPAPSANGTNHQPHHEISLAASSSSASNSPSLKHKVVPAAFPIKKRKRRSACHSWTNESRAAEIVRQFAPDRTSAIFYLFRRIAGGGMNKNLRIVPAKRNPPKYSCFFEELGMVSDPDNDSHYHVWAFPPINSAASRFMATYVGATELEGVELGGATSDEEDANSGAGTIAKEKPKRGRKRSKENNGEQGLSGKAKKEAKVGDEEGQRRRQGDTTSTDDTSEIELEMEYDEAAYGYHLVGQTVADRARPAQRPGDSTRAKGGTTGNTMTPPILLVSEAQQNGRAYHEQQPQQLPAIHDDHLAHLYSDLAAAEHLSLDEVLEHPALFGPDGVGASGTLSSPSFGNPSELMHTFLLQELDLDSINVDFRKRLTGRSGKDSTDNRAWSVYEGVWQGLNDVAVKIYHEERAYQTECHNLWKFNHPNVLRAYGRLYAIPGRDIQGCVVLEKANLGDLHSWMIDNRRYLHDTQFISHFLDIVKGVAAGMHYIHSSSPALIHGELKPSNILLFGHKFDLHGTPHYLGLRAKITDVGISHDLANDSAVRGRGTTENETARTRLWQPPEQRSSHAAAYYALGTDVLPFGLILWSFWSKAVSVEQLRRVLPLSGAERPPIPKECPTQWASLIERCWAHDTRERISFKALLEELGKIQP